MSFWRKLISEFVPGVGEPVDWEAVFLKADLGLELTQKLTAKIEAAGFTRNEEKAEALIRSELLTLLADAPPPEMPDKPTVILLVGVNGSGKTTTAAKLARYYQAANYRLHFGAADTFRAAAIDQLQAWGERVGVPVTSGPPNSDPASVAFRAYEAAEDEAADLLIVDTAGRQANRSNLMLELQKVKRTLQKKAPDAPHHVWLVVDAGTGSNILPQAKEFKAAVGVTGLIMTKMEGSGRGGMIAAVRAELGIPTLFVGRGEGLYDFEAFSPTRFVDEFLGDEAAATAASKG